MNLISTIVTSSVIHIILAVIIIGSILLQSSDNGLEGAFGGSGVTSDTLTVTRRGPEAFFFQTTIFTAILLLGLLVATAIVSA